MRVMLAIFLCVVMFGTAGCWDQKLLEDLALVFGAAVDADPDDPEMFFLAVTTPAFSEDAAGLTNKSVVHTRSISQGLMNMQLQRERKLEFGKAGVLIFDQAAAKGGTMFKVIRQLDQLRDANPNAWVVITEGISAREALFLEPPEEQRVAIYLDDMLVIGYNEGQIPELTLSQFWARHHSWGICPVVPTIRKTENDSLMLLGLALIDQSGKMVGQFNDGETVMFMLVTGELTRGRMFTELNYEDQTNRWVTIFIKKVDRNVSARIINDKAILDVKLHVEAEILNIDMAFDDHLSKEIFSGLERALARDLQGNILKVIDKAKHAGSDPFGFGQHVRIQNSDWARGKTWCEELKNSEVNVEVRVTIKRIGTLINPSYD